MRLLQPPSPNIGADRMKIEFVRDPVYDTDVTIDDYCDYFINHYYECSIFRLINRETPDYTSVIEIILKWLSEKPRFKNSDSDVLYQTTLPIISQKIEKKVARVNSKYLEYDWILSE